MNKPNIEIDVIIIMKETTTDIEHPVIEARLTGRAITINGVVLPRQFRFINYIEEGIREYIRSNSR